MNKNKDSFPNQLLLIGKWLAITILGWAVSLLAVGGVSIHSWAEWQASVVSYFLNGVLIGTVIGFGQSRIFVSPKIPGLKLMLVSLVVYGIGLPAGVGLTSAVAFWTWPSGIPMMAGLPSTFMDITLSNVAPGAGLVVGLGQWLILRGRVLPATWRGVLLWILGNIGGLAIGGVIAGVIGSLTWLGYFSPLVGPIIARLMVGTILGLITGVILVGLRQSMQPQLLIPS